MKELGLFSLKKKRQRHNWSLKMYKVASKREVMSFFPCPLGVGKKGLNCSKDDVGES